MYESIAYNMKNILNVAGTPVEEFIEIARKIYNGAAATELEAMRKKTKLRPDEWKGTVNALLRLKEDYS